jgi:NADPH-dependent 2,4-dienoyl-CoA reductase/sulfur reductase-like enzyme
VTSYPIPLTDPVRDPGTDTETAPVVIIGGGPTGLMLAIELPALGRRR